MQENCVSGKQSSKSYKENYLQMSNGYIREASEESEEGEDKKIQLAGSSHELEAYPKTFTSELNGVRKGKYRCVECDKIFEDRHKLERHRRLHKGVKPFTSGIYGSGFNPKENVLTHLGTLSKDNPLSCKTCGKTFTSKSYLNKHCHIHSDEKRYECVKCSKVFSEVSHLKMHFLTHTQEKLFLCTICGRSFNQKCNLLKHNRLHSAVDSYECDICKMAFGDKKRFEVHLYSHASKNSQTCLKGFSSENELYFHKEASAQGANGYTEECSTNFRLHDDTIIPKIGSNSISYRPKILKKGTYLQRHLRVRRIK